MGKMKTVKFRVWNGKEMVYDIMAGKFGIFYVNPEKGDGLNTKDTACLSENTTKYPEGTPLMQFTGLLDKNGRKIFVGDFLSKRWKTEIYQNDEGTFMVKFHVNPKVNKPMSLKKYLKSRKKAGTYQEDNIIIGNIYENPELLNQKGKKK